MVVCLPRATVSLPSGTFFDTVEPAPIVALLPTLIGAISEVLDPINALSPIIVWCFLTPS